MAIKNIPLEERPRERLVRYGVSSLSMQELLAIILKTGTKNNKIESLVEDILICINQIKNIENLSLNNLLKINGIGVAKACTLLASIELGNRINNYVPTNNKLKFSDPDVIFDYFKSFFKTKKQEEFYCLYLDNQKNLIDKKLLFKGTVNQSLIHPREIFKEAYLLSASFIICLHNHPTGDVTPSLADINSTKMIYDLGKIHGIKLIDHLIIGKEKYYSFYMEKNVIL